jgi:hypothetical protein
LRHFLGHKTASVFHLDYGKNELIKSPKKAKKFGKLQGCQTPLMPSIYTFKGISLINKDHHTYTLFSCKVEKILEASLDSIPSPSSSVKIQIMDGKVCLRCKDKTLLGVVNKRLKTKSLLTLPSNVLPYHLK